MLQNEILFGVLFLIKDSSMHFEADSEYVISFYAGRTNFVNFKIKILMVFHEKHTLHNTLYWRIVLL